MAFSDALRSGGSGQADVVLRADTGQFNAEVDQAERNWRESIGSMSKEALKLDLANDRLRKSLAQYGAESAQAKRATIGLKEAEEAAARAADKQTRETQQLGRETQRASSGFASMRNRIVGLTAAYIGTYGLVAGIRSSLEAAKEEQNVMGQTRVALEALGISYDQHIDRLEQVIRAQSKLGFDDEALMQTFQMFVRSTKDVDEALRLNALAVDVARGRYIDLEQASQIVNKANLGMSGALRRIGLDVDKNATRQQLLNTLTQNYGRAAEAAAKDGIAASDRLAVEWENMQEVLGRGLVPAVTELSDHLSDYLGDAENQRRVQQRVNEAVETGEDVVRGFAGAIRIAHGMLKPFIDLLGGAENAAKLFFLAFAARKVLGIVGAVRALTAAIALLGPTSVRSAAVSVTAMNTIGTAAAINAGKVAALRGALAGLGGLPGLAIAGLALGGYWGITHSETRPSFQALMAAAISGQLTMEDLERLKKFLPASEYNALRAIIQTRGSNVTSGRIGDAHDRGGADVGSDAADRGAGGKAGNRRDPSEADLQLALAKAGTTPGSADDLRALNALRAYYARQIRVLEARKNLNDAQKERLRQLYGDIAATQSQIDAITEAGESKVAAQQEASNRKQEAADKKAMDRAMRAAERQQRNLAALDKYDFSTRAGLRAAALRGLKASTATSSTTTTDRRGGLDLVREFLEIQSRYGPNFFPPGAWGPGASAQAGMHPVDAGTRRSITIEQNFVTAPTDYFREARFALGAVSAVFDG